MNNLGRRHWGQVEQGHPVINAGRLGRLLPDYRSATKQAERKVLCIRHILCVA
jgi:hypothetical protein